MKNKITQMLLIAMLVCTTAFAGKNDDKVSKPVLTEFTNQFSDATEVNWSSTSSYVKASFKLNGQYMAAYYTISGEVLGIARNLVSTQLPVKLQYELKKNVAGGWISDLFEYSGNEETTYYATIENADQKIIIQSTGNAWTVTKKITKN